MRVVKHLYGLSREVVKSLQDQNATEGAGQVAAADLAGVGCWPK